MTKLHDELVRKPIFIKNVIKAEAAQQKIEAQAATIEKLEAENLSLNEFANEVAGLLAALKETSHD